MYLLLIRICLTFHSFYTLQANEDVLKEFYLKGVFIPKVRLNPLTLAL